MRLEDCPPEIFGIITSYLDFFEVGVVLPCLGNLNLSKRLLLPQSYTEVVLKNGIWLKCPSSRWSSMFLPYRHISRLVIDLVGLKINLGPSWIQSLPKTIVHIDFEFDNAEHIWWRYTSPEGGDEDKWRTLLFSGYVRGTYGYTSLSMRELFPRLEFLRLFSNGMVYSGLELNPSLAVPLSPLNVIESKPYATSLSSCVSLRWLMDLPVGLKFLEAPELLHASWNILKSQPLTSSDNKSWRKWQSIYEPHNDDDDDESNFEEIEPCSDCVWSLPLPASLTHLSLPGSRSNILDGISPRLASRLQSLVLTWTNLPKLNLFPQLRHLTLSGDWGRESRDYSRAYVPPRLQTLKFRTLAPKSNFVPFLNNWPTALQSFRLPDSDFCYSPAGHVGFDWAEAFEPQICHLPLTTLHGILSTPYFSTKCLPMTLTHLSVSIRSVWREEYSRHLPPSLTSLLCQMTSKSDDDHYNAFLELPPSVTRISLPTASNITLEHMALCFPKTIREVFLPSVRNILDVDIARIPRHWTRMSLGSIVVTGRTIPKDRVGKLTIFDFGDSIVPLLPPLMSPFWKCRSCENETCVLTVPSGGMSLPPGIVELDLFGFNPKADTLDGVFSKTEPLDSLLVLSCAQFKIPVRRRKRENDASSSSSSQNPHSSATKPANMRFFEATPIPPTVTSLRSSCTTSPSLISEYEEGFPESLTSLSMPRRAATRMPYLPNLEFLECHADTVDWTQMPRLHTIVMKGIPSSKFPLKNITNSITSLKIDTSSFLKLTTEVLLPPSLRALHLPSAASLLKVVLELPSTLTQLELKTITVKSSHLVPLLPKSSKVSLKLPLRPPNTDGSTLAAPSLLERHLSPSQIDSLKSRVSPHWLDLNHLSHSEITPIIDYVLKERHSELNDMKYAVDATWKLIHVPLLPPKLVSFNIPILTEEVVEGLEYERLLSDIGERKSRIRFFSPNKGRMATSRVESTLVFSQLLMKPCYGAIASTMTHLRLDALELPHWAPKLLPRTLVLLACDSSLFNVASYGELPSSLTALSIMTSGRFHRPHASSLPVGLKSLHISNGTLGNSTIERLPRGLEELAFPGINNLDIRCIPLLPPNLRYFQLPYYVDTEPVPHGLPASVIHIGQTRGPYTGLLSLYLASLS